MLSDNVFDVLMEIRKVDKEIAEYRQKGQKTQEKLVILEGNIHRVKELQLKALSVLKVTEIKSEAMSAELKNMHNKYDEIVKYLNTYDNSATATTTTTAECLHSKEIEIMKKQRDDLKKELNKAKLAKEDIARKLNDIEMQVNIQKKKNLAILLRLKKNLEELLEEEATLINKLK